MVSLKYAIYVHACVHTNIHTYIQFIHTYIHTYIHTEPGGFAGEIEYIVG
jgi:hypothetical protein